VTRRIQPTVWWIVMATLGLWAVVAWWVQVPFSDLAGLTGAGEQLAKYFPPDATGFGRALGQMGVTIVIGIWGTLLAFALAVPLGLAAATNVHGSRMGYRLAREILNFCRALPDPLLALIFITGFGIGPFPGVLALGIHSCGFLGKAFAESLERLPPGIAEGLQACGASRSQVIRFGLWPSIGREVIGYTAYTTYRNILMAVALGVVGAGGIGVDLLRALRQFDRPAAAMMIGLIVAVVVLIDWFAVSLRERSK